MQRGMIRTVAENVRCLRAELARFHPVEVAAVGARVRGFL
jgi:hypothetical protein